VQNKGLLFSETWDGYMEESLQSPVRSYCGKLSDILCSIRSDNLDCDPLLNHL